MARLKEWGYLCPADGGLLLSLKGTDLLYCPNQQHDGAPNTAPGGARTQTQAFFARDQAQEGYAVMAEHPSGTGLTEKQIKAMQTAAKTDDASDAAAEAAVNKPKAVRKAKEPKQCTCGCGGMTKGGSFLPGHDARYHAAQRAAAQPVESI